MQTVTVELTHPHAFKILKDLEIASLIKLQPKAKEKRLTKKQQAFVNDLKQALHEVDLFMEGKIKLQDAREMLNEL